MTWTDNKQSKSNRVSIGELFKMYSPNGNVFLGTVVRKNKLTFVISFNDRPKGTRTFYYPVYSSASGYGHAMTARKV